MELHTISIVDDDPAVRDALRRLLDACGLPAQSFPSGQEFLNSPLASQTTCLILDVRMPGIDGLEVQRRLTAFNHKIPIVFISAHADEEVRARAMEAGAVAFFVKPFSNEALLTAIEEARATPGKQP